MRTSDYDYELPRKLIAQRPLRRRSDARLMVIDRSAGSWVHAHIRDLPEFLRAPDTLVLNDTRVVPARLVGYRTLTGGRWNGLFLATNEQGLWKVLSQTRGKLQPGETVTLLDRDSREHSELTMVTPLEGGVWVAKPAVEGSFADLLEAVGRVPLPPYIRGGEMEREDVADYQTVYAEHAGAIAAPTAGLHFTQELLAELSKLGVQSARLTLHVGVGTFRPMAAERVEDHQIHAEWACLEQAVAEQLLNCRQKGGRIIAVGTTSVRTLETAAGAGELASWSGETNLYIHPPYQFRAVDALLTNFHLPKSTLLVLVRTFGGDELIRAAYAEAVREQYRFYSYGDAMLIV